MEDFLEPIRYEGQVVCSIASEHRAYNVSNQEIYAMNRDGFDQAHQQRGVRLLA